MTNTDQTQKEMKTQKPKRKVLRWIISIVIILILIPIILVLSAPTFLSSGFMRSKIVNQINNRIPGSVEIQELDFNWFSGQKVSGFELRDPQNQVVARFDEFSTEVSLWGLAVSGNYNLGITKLDKFKANITSDKSGVTNLEKAVSSIEQPEKEMEAPPSKEYKESSEKLSEKQAVPLKIPKSLAINAEMNNAKNYICSRGN